MLLLSQIPMGSRSAWAQSNGVMDLAVLVRWIYVDIQLKASWGWGLFVPLDGGMLGNLLRSI